MILKTTLKTDELARMWKKLNANAKDLRVPLRKIGGMLEDASESAFERQGPGWKPLTAKYKARKAKEFGPGKKILERKGELADSISSRITAQNAVAIGSIKEYAPPHFYGSPKQGIPKRNFMPVGEAQIRKANFIMSKHLVKGV